MIYKTSAPDNNRIEVNPDASIEFPPRASRHRTELAAKAIIASTVDSIVFIVVGPELFMVEIVIQLINRHPVQRTPSENLFQDLIIFGASSGDAK